MGPNVAGDAHHLVGGRHLQIELDVDQLVEPAHVGVLDVPPILAEVDGDPISAAELGLGRGPDGLGLVRPSRLAHRGHMVDVYTKVHHVGASVDDVAALHKDTTVAATVVVAS